ncbi:MAG: PAS domain S-box protein [Patescibacteria group bacterium]
MDNKVDDKLPQLITLAEACALLKCHPNTLRIWDKQGLLKSIRFGARKIRKYRKEDILKVLDGRYSNDETYTDNFLDVPDKFRVTINKSLDGIIQSWNTAAEELYGYKANEVIGKHISILFPQSNKVEFTQIMDKLAKGIAITNHNTIRKRKDGIMISVVIDITPIRTKDGQVIGAEVMARKNLENKFSNDFYNYEYLMENMTDAVVSTTPDFVITGWNKASENLFGYKKIDVLGKSTSFVINAKLSNDTRNKIRALLKEKGSWVGEFVMANKNGKEMNLLATVSDIKTSEKQKVGYLIIYKDITDQKKTLSNLKEAEQKFKATFDQAAVGMAQVSLDGRFILVNDKLAGILGYSKNELLSKTFQEITYYEDLQKDLHLAKKLQEGSINSYTIEKRYIKKNGSIIWAKLTGSVVKNHEGSPIYFIEVIEDIDEKKKIEFDLQSSKAQLQSVFEAMKDGVVVADMKGNFLMANSAQAEINEFKNLDEMLYTFDAYKDLYSFWDLEGNEVLPEKWPLARILQGESLNRIILKARRNDIGKEWYFSFSGEPILDKNGKQVMAVVVTRDITIRKLSEMNLIASEQRFKMLADNIENLCWIADPKGDVYWYNKRWYVYTGTTKRDVVGWEWQKLISPKHLPKVNRKWKSSIKTGKPFDMTYLLKGADGIYKPFLTRVNPVRDEKGKITHWFGTNTDITEQKKIEERKDEFLSIASHELKTPLTSIKAYTQILEKIIKEIDHTKAEYIVKKTNLYIDRLNNLITDLLDVSRIQAGKLQMNIEKINIYRVLVESVDGMQATCRTHKISINGKCKCKMMGDKNRLDQVFQNILSNAIKYSPNSDRVEVDISCNDKNIQISFRDFGVGISPKAQKNIFKRFYRVEKTAQGFSGLGIGLYICHEIIERHNGRILINSKENEGSTFTIILPTIKG